MRQEGKAKQMEAKRKRASSRQGPCLIRGNPRIFKAHLFGGKDRHSKVYTIKGLRDRRIRLSTPTAIQIYDLQNRLGLTQPSKVIDWLIQVTSFEIDKLPPLHFQNYFDPNDSILHQSSFIVSQICHFDAAVEAKNEETERVLVQKLSPFTNHDSVSALPRNAHDFQVSSFSSPLMEAHLASVSSFSSASLLFCPVTRLSEVSPDLRYSGN